MLIRQIRRTVKQMSRLVTALQEMNAREGLRLAGSLILKVKGYEGQTVQGQVMTGEHAGVQIRVHPNGYLTIDDYTSESSIAHTPPGGFLRVQGIKADRDSAYTCRWMRTFDPKPTSAHHHVFDAVATQFDTGRDDSFGKPLMYVHALCPEKEVHARDMTQLEHGLERGFESHGSVTLFASEMDGMIQSAFFRPHGPGQGQRPMSPGQRASEIIQNLSGFGWESLSEVLSLKGVSVVPTSSFRIGSETARQIRKESERNARGFNNSLNVDPESYAPPSIGMRVLKALSGWSKNSLGQDQAGRFETLFLSEATPKTKESWPMRNWLAASDEEYRRFFRGYGIELRKWPARGWAVSSILLKGHQSGEGQFVSKVFATRFAAPYPKVVASEKALSTYYSEIPRAIKSALGAESRLERELEAKRQ